MASEEEFEQDNARFGLRFLGFADCGDRHRILRVRSLVLAVVNQQGDLRVRLKVDVLAPGTLGQNHELSQVFGCGESHQAGEWLRMIFGRQHRVTLGSKQILQNSLNLSIVVHFIPAGNQKMRTR